MALGRALGTCSHGKIFFVKLEKVFCGFFFFFILNKVIFFLCTLFYICNLLFFS